jgi:hypothetical protein
MPPPNVLPMARHENIIKLRVEFSLNCLIIVSIICDQYLHAREILPLFRVHNRHHLSRCVQDVSSSDLTLLHLVVDHLEL